MAEDDRDRREELAGAVKAVLERQQEDARDARTAKARPGRSVPWSLLLVANCAILAWIWAGRPGLLFGPAVPEPLPATLHDARVRYALYLQRARIDAFRKTAGRLPDSLAESGPVELGVAYRHDGSGYVLEGREEAVTLHLTDRMAADSFLGDAVTRLANHRAR